jgi:hypothetical protein
MSYTDKIAQATKLIEEHNAEIESPEDKVKVEDFTKKLKKLGGTTEAALKECTWEDLENAGLPRILARKVAALFRVEAKTQLGDGDFISEKKASRMSPLYLLQQYVLGDTDTPVAKRLAEISKGARFLVVEGGTLNVAESFKILQELQKGYADREVVVLDGRPVRPVRIGDKKKEMVDENPIYAGRPLRPDGTCDQLNRSWEGVSLPVRQIIYLALHDTRELTASHSTAHDLLDKALSADAEKAFRQRYAKASIRLDELTEEGKAPTLKIALSATSFGKRNDPFHGSGEHKTY